MNQLPEALAVAAYGVWLHNGHDVPGALLHVHRNGSTPGLRAMAGEAYDLVLAPRRDAERPFTWDAFEAEFRSRAEAERWAAG